MRRTLDTVWDMAGLVTGVLIGGILLTLFGQAWRSVPGWLGSAFPSVETTGADAVSRVKDSACVVLHLHKLRPGRPLDPVFHVKATGATYSSMVNIAVHRADEKGRRLNLPFTEHPIDARWDSYYCFDMPGTITPADSVDVTGNLEHQRWFGRVQEPFGPITVKAVE